MSTFRLRSSTIRLGIFISTLLIAVIIIFQLAWLSKVYRLEQKEFNLSILKSIRGLYEDLEVTAYNSAHLEELVENPEPHLYLARISLPVNKDSLADYLQYELEDFDVFTLCRIGLYETGRNRFTLVKDLHIGGVQGKAKRNDSLPLIKKEYDYLALYFPYRRRFIIAQMNVWIISSIALLVVLVLFSAGLFYFYRQKFINEIQKDFTYSFAHEFKTPVSVIALAADVLSDEAILDKPAKLARYSGIVKYQADYLHKQIEKLLQFANADSKKLQLRKESVDIHAIIEEAAGNLAPLILEKQVELHYALDAAPSVLRGDKNYLLIVMINMLENAIKYSKEPHISIVTRNDSHQIQISITDNGIGIDKKDMKRIFMKFYRAGEGEVYTTKGFGLGLSFVRMIISAHKGRVDVKSIPGLGSTFEIYLPLK